MCKQEIHFIKGASDYAEVEPIQVLKPQLVHIFPGHFSQMWLVLGMGLIAWIVVGA